MGDLVVVGGAAIGGGTAAILLSVGSPRRRALAAAAIPVSLGSLSLATFAVLALGFRLGALAVLGTLVPILAYLALIDRRWRATAAPPPASAAASPSPGLPTSSVWILAILTAGFVAWCGARWIRAWPHGSADAVNIWTSRGLLLARVGGEIPERLSWMSAGHPDYPLLLPGALAGLYTTTGSESLHIPQAVGVAWLLAVLAAVLAVSSRWTGTTFGLLATATVAANPLLMRWAFVQCADVPVACLLLLGLGAGWAILRGRREGPGVRDGLYLSAGLAPAAAAWVVFRLVWLRDASTYGYLRRGSLQSLTDLDRWRSLLTTGPYELLLPGRMGGSAMVLVALVVIVLFLLVRRTVSSPPQARWLLAVSASLMLAYMVAYLLSPNDIVWHVSTSIDRLSLQLMPTLVVACGMILSR